MASLEGYGASCFSALVTGRSVRGRALSVPLWSVTGVIGSLHGQLLEAGALQGVASIKAMCDAR